jgi:hypothetical protein
LQLTVGGRPLDLGVNGSVGHLDGFSCAPPRFTVWSAGLVSGGKAYAKTVRRYRLDGSHLILLGFRNRRVRNPMPGGKFIECMGLNSSVA